MSFDKTSATVSIKDINKVSRYLSKAEWIVSLEATFLYNGIRYWLPFDYRFAFSKDSENFLLDFDDIDSFVDSIPEDTSRVINRVLSEKAHFLISCLISKIDEKEMRMLKDVQQPIVLFTKTISEEKVFISFTLPNKKTIYGIELLFSNNVWSYDELLVCVLPEMKTEPDYFERRNPFSESEFFCWTDFIFDYLVDEVKKLSDFRFLSISSRKEFKNMRYLYYKRLMNNFIPSF